MAHNPVIRGVVGSGLWTGVVTAGEWELFDQRQFQAINGDLGGTWAPAAVIIIGGSGLRVTGAFEVTGVTTLTGNALIQGSTLTVTANSTIAGTCDFNGVVTINNDVMVQGSGTLFAFAASASTPTFANGLTTTAGVASFGSGLTVTAGTASFGSQVNVAAGFKFLAGSTPVVEEKMAINAGGHVKWRRVNGAATAHTYAIADADAVVVQVGTFAGAVTYTMSNTGCTGGEIIEIMNNDGSANLLTVVQHNGVTGIANLKAATKIIGVRLINNGSGSTSAGWEVLGYYTIP